MNQQQVADIIRRLAAGEQIEGWSYHPEQTTLHGDSQYAHTEPTSAFYNGQGYWADGNPMRNQTLDLKEVAKLAAIMGGAYLGGTALAGGGGGAAGAAGAGGGSTLGSLGNITALGTPAAELGAVTGLSTTAAGALPSIGAGVGSALSGVGSALSGVGSALGGLKTIAPLVGGLLGTQKAPDQTETRTNRMDPRMEAYIYGSGQGDTNGLLGAAQDWFKTNRSGMNDTMRMALEQQIASYTDPQFRNNLNSARQSAMGLLSMPVAGNPFTRR